MTTALVESPLSLFGEARRFEPAGGRGITLEELLETTLRSAKAGGTAACPMCHEELQAENGAAHCSGCGSTLS